MGLFCNSRLSKNVKARPKAEANPVEIALILGIASELKLLAMTFLDSLAHFHNHMQNEDIQQNEVLIKEKAGIISDVLTEVRKRIIGQKYIINRLLIGILSRGHVLLEGVPGLAKTASIKALSDVTHLGFKRIQFTPDLLPADLIGTRIFDQKTSEFSIKRGPVFTNFILADEINRAPAKVQSALLESMQEKQVTIGDETFPLPNPFFVMATQNPIEQEGTYPLPEAQVDRFMLKVNISYPNTEEEIRIVNLNTAPEEVSLSGIIGGNAILELQDIVSRIYVDEKIIKYIIDIVNASRNPDEYGLKDLAYLINYGGSPRASINLAKAAKAHAFLDGRGYVIPEDIKEIGPDVLRHRIITTYEAEAEDVTPEDIIKKIFDGVKVP